MKKTFIILLFTFLIQFAFAQKHSIVGAWYWSDSVKATSFFFNKNGEVSMRTGLKNNVILEKKLRKGKYDLKNNTLVITWTKTDIERRKIKFIDKNSFQVSLADKKNKKLKNNFIFKRVIDEEIIEDKGQ